MKDTSTSQLIARAEIKVYGDLKLKKSFFLIPVPVYGHEVNTHSFCKSFTLGKSFL